MGRPIAISLSPNTEVKDVAAAIRLLINPFSYRKGENIGNLEQWFGKQFKMGDGVSFRSGRDALYALLKAYGIGQGDEVIIQAFTCVAVPNAVIWTGAVSVYADIDKRFGIDPTVLAKKISSRTRAIIVQHTFGIASAVDEIVKIGKERGIVIIEDCAHVIGGEYRGKKLGMWGDASFFSFGRDKAFSSVFGGMVLLRDKKVRQKVVSIQKNAPYPSVAWIIQQLFHPIAFSMILPLYNVFGIGKALLYLLQKIRLLSFPVSNEEKRGKLVTPVVYKFPNSLCSLALLQLLRIDDFNKKRKQIAKLYSEHLKLSKLKFSYDSDVVYLRFPVIVEQKQNFFEFAKKKGMLLGSWYGNVIDPKGVDFRAIGYKKGLCPNAEVVVSKIINLPVYPSMTIHDAQKVIELVNDYENHS